jgi:hypothetical protein
MRRLPGTGRSFKAGLDGAALPSRLPSADTRVQWLPAYCGTVVTQPSSRSRDHHTRSNDVTPAPLQVVNVHDTPMIHLISPTIFGRGGAAPLMP